MPNSKRKFWQQFLKSRKEIGSVTPSSRFLTKRMMSKIDFSEAKVILELGPGTGVFTSEIINRMRPDCQLIVVELNKPMFDLLEQKFRDPRVSLVHGSATDIQKILETHGHNKVDVVVSSLPLSVMPDNISEEILKASSFALKPKGKYVQFMYSLLLKKKLNRHFPGLKQSYVLLNLPPAFVFDCKKNEA